MVFIVTWVMANYHSVACLFRYSVVEGIYDSMTKRKLVQTRSFTGVIFYS